MGGSASTSKDATKAGKGALAARAETPAEDEDMDLNIVHDDLFLQQAFQRPANLQEVLRRPHMRYQFREFLRRSLAQENLLFFDTIEMYQKITNERMRQRTGAEMVSKFLEPHSLYQVNLPARVTERLRKTAYFEADTFDTAKREIFRLMSDNFFNRFVRALDDSERHLREENERKRAEAERRKQGSFASRVRRASSNAFALMRRTSSSRNLDQSTPSSA